MSRQAEPVPAWLLAWRAKQGLSVPQSLPTATAVAELLPMPPTPRADKQRFVEPRCWPYDNGSRREPVLDTDQNPPRGVRYVGWRACLRCRRPYFSPGVQGVRLCFPCKDQHQ